MISVRRITDPSSPSDRAAIEECQAMIRTQFPGMPSADIDKIPDLLVDPLKYRFVATLFVAEYGHGRLRGCALLLNAPDLKFAYLDTITAAPGRTGGGVGAILYQAVRQEALDHKASGLYFECLPDDPALSPDTKIRRQNASRLRFYERYGARPIMGTAYETPITPGATDSPYLVFDGLGRHQMPRAARLKEIMRAILERKYGDTCPPSYIEKVIASIKDSTLHLRAPKLAVAAVKASPEPFAFKIPLIVNDKHEIHHIRERGYVQAPVRIAAITAELDKSDLFDRVEPQHFPDKWVRAVHDDGLVDYIIAACAEAPERKSLYPYVFPIRNPERKPKDKSVLAGYWCIDTFTPLNRNAYPAARRAVDCALTAAERVRTGAPIAYALVRPPGHHAERSAFGGFCYFNNSAIAAHYLSANARVAVLDVDYHHGNGTQDIFYERADVLTVSIHGDPSIAYPYFTGFRSERGRGQGQGFNLNLPLAEKATPEEHRGALTLALRRIERHQPDYLVLALGLDPARGDPTGTWSLTGSDFRLMGRMIGALGLPIVAVQEGGYLTRTLGSNARNVFQGLMEGRRSATPRAKPLASAARPPSVRLRDHVSEVDVGRIVRIVEASGFFTPAEIRIASELAQERLTRGRNSGYEFVIAERGGEMMGYACYGPTAGTDGTYDLYWIVVAREAQGMGLGARILARVEERIARAGGIKIFADTSSTDRYTPTRAFYERMGFRQVALLRDFYRANDSKVIYEKPVANSAKRAQAAA